MTVFFYPFCSKSDKAYLVAMKFTIRVVALIFLIMPVSSMAQRHPEKNLKNLIIGTYTNSGKSLGIYVYSFNSRTGDFNFRSVTKGVENPSYLCLSDNQKFLYAVNEVTNGYVSSFSFNPDKGELSFLNKVNSMGADPCYISIEKKSKSVFVGNYSGGNLSAFTVLPNGALSEAVQTIQHSGNSINTQRQEKAHVHSTVISPDEQVLFVADLGTDKLNSYRINNSGEAEILSATEQNSILVKAGSGPRHLTFHPNGKFAYLIHELTAEVSVYTYQSGQLNFVQTVSMVAPGYTGGVGAADIHVSPDGKFLYASNRGDANELVIYSVTKDGKLKLVGRQSTLGKTPRNFAITPEGNFLLIANQNSDEIVIFKRNKKTGMLTDTGKKIEVGSPVCLLFAKKG
jgi:6-phosphogluconolactonase